MSTLRRAPYTCSMSDPLDRKPLLLILGSPWRRWLLRLRPRPGDAGVVCGHAARVSPGFDLSQAPGCKYSVSERGRMEPPNAFRKGRALRSRCPLRISGYLFLFIPILDLLIWSLKSGHHERARALIPHRDRRPAGWRTFAQVRGGEGPPQRLCCSARAQQVQALASDPGEELHLGGGLDEPKVLGVDGRQNGRRSGVKKTWYDRN